MNTEGNRKHELLEKMRNGNYSPHGYFHSEEAAHAHAKSIGLSKSKYRVEPESDHNLEIVRKGIAGRALKEHEQDHWKKD